MQLPAQSVVPVLLMLTLASCWCLPRYTTWLLAAVSFAVGYGLDVISFEALPLILIMMVSAWRLSMVQTVWFRWLFTGFLFIATAVLLEKHFAPGFHNVLVWDNQPVKTDSVPFTLYLNADKPWPALAVLLFFMGPKQPIAFSLLQTGRQWHQAASLALLPVIAMLIVVFGLALGTGFVRWQPAWPEISWLFLLNNLLITSLAEAALLRGFLQSMLIRHLGSYSWGAFIAIPLPALIHSLAHYPASFSYIALVFIASAFYGWIYQRSRSLEMAVFGQWLLNSCHFLLFSYPAAA